MNLMAAKRLRDRVDKKHDRQDKLVVLGLIILRAALFAAMVWLLIDTIANRTAAVILSK